MFFLEVRIISPTGRLLTVNRAVPIVETIFDFNGESRFLGDICRNGTKPNGIAILYDSSSIFEDNLSELVVGNLQSDVVEQIMQSLLVNGYYDFSKMGTTEEFPCSLEYDGEVWEFYLPPTPSVKNGTTARNVGRYIGYLVKNLLRQHEEVYGRIERLTSPVVVFEFGLSELTPLYRAFDADNRDNKRILDAMTGTFFEDDNVLSVMTVHYGVISPCSCTRVYVMEEVVYREWKSKNSQL